MVVVKLTDIKEKKAYRAGFKRYERETKHEGWRHRGQRKLYLSEVQYLTKVHEIIETLKDPPELTVLYIGAAPGNHILALIKAFPKVRKWVLYDEVSFDNRLENEQSVEINSRLFTNDDIEKYAKLDGVALISDIRTITGDKPAGYYVESDQTMQQTWIQGIKPFYGACIKFHPPYYTTEYEYLDGEVYVQAWPPIASEETRLHIMPDYSSDNPLSVYDKMKMYDSNDFEDRMYFFNTEIRTRGEGDQDNGLEDKILKDWPDAKKEWKYLIFRGR